MSAEQKELEQNALASRLGRAWANFKQGKLLSYRVMAILLLVVAGLGLWWYLSAERKKAASARWLELDDANSPGKLEEIIKKDPNAVTGRVAQLLVARGQLGRDGIDLLSSPRSELRAKGIENVVKAREAFEKLVEQFKDDPVLKAECLFGLAKAEAALVGVPEKIDQPVGPEAVAPAREFRGKVSKVIEYLDQLAAAAAPDTPWATDSKKMADDLRKDEKNFAAVSRSLFEFIPPSMPKFDPHDPLGPLAPGGSPPGGTPSPPLPPGVPGVPGGK